MSFYQVDGLQQRTMASRRARRWAAPNAPRPGEGVAISTRSAGMQGMLRRDQSLEASLPAVARAGVAEASAGPGGPRWISHCRHASAVSGGE